MFVKFLTRKVYKRLSNERDKYLQKCNEFNRKLVELEEQQNHLKREAQKYKQDYEQLKEKYKQLQEQCSEIKEQKEIVFNKEIENRLGELGFDKERFESLWKDRLKLIELYINKLYSLAKNFARENRKIGKNRGLFLILVDSRNMNDTNFSKFHEEQKEYLMDNQYRGIDNIPQIFSEKIHDVFNYMGEEEPIRNEQGEIIGYEERDGAVLVDLRGVVFRTCLMVEGVRTHKVYNKVERLIKGSARHNAAIYASSLDEVIASFVVSQETSEVTVFQDGKFIKSYNPYTNNETLHKGKIIQMKYPTYIISDEEKRKDKKEAI